MHTHAAFVGVQREDEGGSRAAVDFAEGFVVPYAQAGLCAAAGAAHGAEVVMVVVTVHIAHEPSYIIA